MKTASVSLIVALMLLFSFTLTGCTWMDKNTNEPSPSAAPSTSPQITAAPTPSADPEITDNDMPDSEDGIVKDEDGIITDGDTGSSNVSDTEKADNADAKSRLGK